MPEPPPPKVIEPTPETATETVFEPYKGKIRKSGTECEEKRSKLIKTMKAEIAEMKKQAKNV